MKKVNEMRAKAREIFERADGQASRLKEIPILIADELEGETLYDFDELMDILTSGDGRGDWKEEYIDLITIILEGDA